MFAKRNLSVTAPRRDRRGPGSRTWVPRWIMFSRSGVERASAPSSRSHAQRCSTSAGVGRRESCL